MRYSLLNIRRLSSLRIPHFTTSTLSLLPLVLSLCLFNSCGHSHDHEGHHHDHTMDDAPSTTSGQADDDHDDAKHDASAIHLPYDKAKSAGVIVEIAKSGTFHGIIPTSGMVMAASCDETTVVATMSGRIGHTGHLSEGMHVAGGTRLYTITSAEMLNPEGDPVQRARIQYDKAERDYERARQLVKDRIISDKDFQLAKAEFEAAELTYNAIRRNRSAGGIVVSAPKAGYVKQNLVKEGDYVDAGQPLMVITQNQHLYLRAEVPERRWNELSKVVGAKFRTSYSHHLYDVREMGGHVQSYGRSAEPQNAYIPIIFEFNNTGDVIQGSYAEIFLITSDRPNVITLPVSAITEEQGVHFTYIQTDEDHYRKQEVTLGSSDGERIEVRSGIHAGDRVVTKGVVQVRLASASTAIPGHTHNH